MFFLLLLKAGTSISRQYLFISATHRIYEVSFSSNICTQKGIKALLVPCYRCKSTFNWDTCHIIMYVRGSKALSIVVLCRVVGPLIITPQCYFLIWAYTVFTIHVGKWFCKVVK